MFRVWCRLLGLCDKTVLEDVDLDEGTGVVVAHVRPKARVARRCGRCGRRSSRFDNGDGRRRWRGLDLGTVQVFFEADAPQHCRRTLLGAVQCLEGATTRLAVPSPASTAERICPG